MSDQLTEEQTTEFRENFQLFDKGDGIMVKDLGMVMRACHQNPTAAELGNFILEFDPDGSGFIDFQQFSSMMARKVKDVDTEEDIMESFKVFDKDGSGFMSVAELKYILTNLGEKLASDEDFEEMIKEAVVNDDGLIQYEEFIKVIMSK